MRPYVSETAWRLVSELGRAEDYNPLRLGLNGDETPTADVISDALLDLGDRREAIADSLSSSYAAHDRYQDGDRDIDEITAQLIAHLGYEPLMVAWLAAQCGGIHISDEDGERLIDVDVQFKPHETRTQDTEVALGDGVWWKACGAVLVDGAPDTIMLAAAGRPLASVISHPVLDALGMDVARVELGGSGVDAELQIDLEHVYPTVDQLAEMEPSR